VNLQDAGHDQELVESAGKLRPLFEDTHPTDDEFIRLLLTMEPYGSSPDFESAYRIASNAS
jgi:hypothetical protein